MSLGSHIIPKFYLEQFATASTMPGKDRPGRIWVYERGNTPDERATSVQGVENGYFGYVKPDGTLEESFESELAKLETECDDVLVSSKSTLFNWQSPGNRNRIAFYAALLFSRSTQRRDSHEKIWSGIQEELKKLASDHDDMRQLANEFSDRYGEQISPDDVRTRLLTIVGRSATSGTGKNEFLNSLLAVTDALKESLLKKPWQVWRVDSGVEFITSDNPVCTYLDLGGGVFHPGYGVEYPGVVVIFPVAPTACLAMGLSGRDSVTKSSPEVEKVNTVIAQLCGRFVYSRTFHESVRILVDEHGGESRYLESAFVPVGMPTARQYLRRRFGLQEKVSSVN